MYTKLKHIAQRVGREMVMYKLVLQDKRTPLLGKILLGLAVGYFLLPFDLIPDFIPVVGHLDDVIIVPLLIIIAFKMIPKEVVENCRRKIKSTDENIL